jgi:YidC/Oxa1 family membrane protein insertase
MGYYICIPFAALLRLFYNLTGSYGVAIILFTLVIKLIMLPFQMKSKRSMVRMGRLSGKQAELQKQYANNQQKYQEELSKLYQEEGINPMGGCLWSLLPLFIIFPLYSIIYRPITHFMRLGEEGLETVRELALSLGYDASKYNANYEQIGLTDFISKNWAAFEGKMDGLLNVDFNFLGLDLSTQPQIAFKSFAFDWEIIETEDARTDNIDGAQLTACARAFCDAIKGYGYQPMIYAATRELYFKYDLSQLKDVELWLKQYTETPTFRYQFAMWQYGENVQMEGVEGAVDLNLFFPTAAKP